jgi:hypothetical protein
MSRSPVLMNQHTPKDQLEPTMIDHDLSDQLHSLAATVDEPFDMAALHRRISAHNRRRAVVKVGFAGAGVAALVGGLFVVRDARPDPVASQVEPAGSPACNDLLTGLRAATSTPDAAGTKGIPTDTPSSGGDAADRGFKGIVTILTIDGPELTFQFDEPVVAPPTTGAGTFDSVTVWVNGPTPLEAPPTLQVGEQVGLATTPASDGVNRVIFIDVGVDAKPTTANEPTTKTKSPTAESETSAAPDRIVLPGASLPPGPTAKSLATITAVDATSITVSFDDAAGEARTSAIDLGSTPFYAGDTQCVPGSLTVGTAIAVAYHFGDADNVISDAVILLP